MFKKIFLYILLLLSPKKEGIYVKDHMIDISFVPQQIYWIDDSNILLSSYGNTLIYNTYNRNSSEIDTCDSCIYGYDGGFVYCKYVHRQIHSMEEFSTTIYLYDMSDTLLYERDLFPTVIPTVCTKNYVELQSAYSFLEQKLYLIDIEKDSFEEISWERKKESEESNGVPKDETVLSKREDLERLIVMDGYSRLWVYIRN